MARTLLISRDQAELMADLLMLSDNPHAYDLGCSVRELFGMCEEARELEYMGMTLAEFQRDWANKLLDRIGK